MLGKKCEDIHRHLLWSEDLCTQAITSSDSTVLTLADLNNLQEGLGRYAVSRRISLFEMPPIKLAPTEEFKPMVGIGIPLSTVIPSPGMF